MISLTYKKQLYYLFCCIIIFFQINLSAQSIHFNNLTTNNGLSNNHIYDLIQDRLGFLWFATDDGLNRFDGYEFKIFRNNPNDKNSISDNSIWTLTEDIKGNIWIGTKNGFINCYDPVLDRFTHWEIKSDITRENPITTIYIDNKNFIWIGTYRSGVYKLNSENGKIDHWKYNEHDKSSLSNNYISSIIEDNFGNIWIGTYNGLNKFNPQKSTTEFKRYFSNKNNTNSISDNIIWAITKSTSDTNEFWIGTANGLTVLKTDSECFSQISIPNPKNLQFGTGAAFVLEEEINNEKVLWINTYAGLLRFNRSKNNFERFVSDKNNPNSLISNQINKILKDRSGVLWIATDIGLSYFSKKNIKFNYKLIAANKFWDASDLNKINVKAITETSDKNLWIGTESGLYHSNVINEKVSFSKYQNLNTENIWALAAGNSNDLWIGTYGSGLFHLNYKTNQVTKKNLLDRLTKSLSKNFVKTLLLDEKDNLWIGYWGVGLVRLNLKTGKIKNWLHNNNDPNSLSHDDVWIITHDSKGRIWVGTNGGGLNLFDESKGEIFYRFNFNPEEQNTLSSNSVYSIIESKHNTAYEGDNTVLWVGTNNGLNKITINNSNNDHITDTTNIKIIHYKVENGLADNSIKSIIEDNNGNLWMGTSSGISFFNVKKEKFTNFYSSDGVIGIDFNFSSALKCNDDLMLIGSTSGLNLFNPKEILQSNYKPRVVITDFQIFNKPVKLGQNTSFKKSIFYTDTIQLSYKQNVFSFQFSALDYNSPNSIKYEYKMEGFDKDWIKVENRRFISYTNLNPGNYLFKVKSTNSDGIWNDKTTTLNVVITPPWWQTEWAIILYFFVFILGVWAIIKFQANRVRLQSELRMREFESYHLREIEKMKSRFFANLSHEFRTPLMLIKSPLEELISGRIKDNIPEYYQMLLRNTEKLQQLIDQLLELSQLESESIPLKTEPHDLVVLLKSFTKSFTPLAEKKSIKFKFTTARESVIAKIDKDKLEKIVNNLLSNAFKFTPVGGIITVDLYLEKKSSSSVAIISISDTGVGIPKELQPKIFDRFFQVDDSSKRSFSGSGIGLALVKELVSLHKWIITVDSSEGEGTEFVIKIPLEPGSEVENLNNQVNNNKKTTSTLKIESNQSPELEINNVENKNDKSLILFVDDSDDVRNYVYDILKSEYNILLAENAEAGLEIALNNLPDLIISDVMMPGMDGFEFCNKIKTDWKTSHIPLILLTAKATKQSKLEGLEIGADEYLTKPFDASELSVRIKNLIAQRKQLREKFGREIIVHTDSLPGNILDRKFMQKIIDVIEKNLHNESFNSELLAKELFVSRSQLNRKLHAIIEQGPGEFIRIYKLKRAAQMIIENKLSITQVALEVGFGSPAQFGRAFQKYFNCLPSEFNNKVQK